MGTYHYLTNCTCSTVPLLEDMLEQAREITWATFRRHVSWKEVQRLFPFYSYRGERYNPQTGELTAPFHIKDDWAVRFWKSEYDGYPCYYITHSGIEYIFVSLDEEGTCT